VSSYVLPRFQIGYTYYTPHKPALSTVKTAKPGQFVTAQPPDYSEPLRLASLGTSPFRGGMMTIGIPKPLLKGEVALLQAGSEGFHGVDAEL